MVSLIHMESYFSGGQLLEFALRIVIAAICGAIIGVERSKRFKDVGLRTSCVVACAAALVMLISKYGFIDTVLDAEGNMIAGVNRTDPARLAAQVVSGISFLGVGIIFRKDGFAIRGLTTAAIIWFVAGVGLSIGAGMYALGIFSTVLILLIQLVSHKYSIGNDQFNNAVLTAIVEENEAALDPLYERLEQWHAVINECSLEREQDKIVMTMTIKISSSITARDFAQVMNECSIIQSLKVIE